MSNLKQNSEELIALLSNDLTKVKVLPHPLKRSMPWLFIAILYVVGSIIYIGVRGDISVKLQEPIYLFELLHVLAISISAALCALWLCVPDMRQQKWIIAVPLSLFGVFIAWVALKSIFDTHKYFELMWGHYHSDSIIFGVIPALSIFVISMKGRTTHPNLMTLMSTLSVGALGYFSLRITCSSENIGHLFNFHILPYLLFGLVMSLLARLIYRW